MSGNPLLKDDPYSAFVRDAKGLDPDWRVYLYEVLESGKVRLTGAIARPSTVHDGRPLNSPTWFKPKIERCSMTVTLEQYRALTRKQP